MKYFKLLLITAVSLFILASCSDTDTTPVTDAETVTETSASTEISIEDTAQPKAPISTIYIDTETGRDVTSKEEYILADFKLTNENGKELEVNGVKIRGRGNQSWNVPKKSYKLKFPEKAALLAGDNYANKDWVLIANHADKSLIRNLMAYTLGRSLDGIEWSPRVELVSVYLNGEYRGVYVLTEQVEAASGRIDIDESDEVGGMLFELDGYAEGTTFIHKFNIGKKKYSIKTDMTSVLRGKRLQDHVSEAYEAVRGGDRETVEQYIDLASAVDMYIICEFMANWDTGFSSFYMYIKEEGGKIYFAAPWDFDLSSGNTINIIDPTGLHVGKLFEEEISQSVHNVWFSALMSYNWFRELVAERWNEVKYIISATVDGCCDYAYKNMEILEGNFEVWDVINTRVNQEPKKVLALNSCKENVDYLNSWLDTRWSWLDIYFNSELINITAP